MLPTNKIANVRRRVNRARRFPDNTCPASRHVHLIAESLLRGNTFWLTEPQEREHVAGSLLSVLESLWKARTKLARVAPTYGQDELEEARKRGHKIAAALRLE